MSDNTTETTNSAPTAVPGANRVSDDRRQQNLMAPLPKIEGALLSVAHQLEHDIQAAAESQVTRTVIADAMKLLAEELHHWL